MIGDVHGCPDELDALVHACAFEPAADALVFVGDLVAKGPDSRGVLARVRDWQAQSALGNHDAAVLQYWPGRTDPAARERPAHRALAATLSEADWQVLLTMPLWLHAGGALVVHAGLVPGVSLADQDPAMLMNMRTLDASGRGSKRPDAGPLWGSRYAGPELVIFGHHARAGLQRHPHAVGLDTGCVYGGALSACILPERRIVSVKARRAYAPVDEGARER